MKRTPIVTLILACALCAAAPLASYADTIDVPTVFSTADLSQLAPGSQFRLAFVSAAVSGTTSSEVQARLADYNLAVNTAASNLPQLAALSTSWQVIASSTSFETWQSTRADLNFDFSAMPIGFVGGVPMDTAASPPTVTPLSQGKSSNPGTALTTTSWSNTGFQRSVDAPSPTYLYVLSDVMTVGPLAAVPVPEPSSVIQLVTIVVASLVGLVVYRRKSQRHCATA